MKKYSIRLYIPAVLAIMISITSSCKKVLEQEPRNSTYADVYWQSVRDCDAAVAVTTAFTFRFCFRNLYELLYVWRCRNIFVYLFYNELYRRWIRRYRAVIYLKYNIESSWTGQGFTK